MVVEDGFRGAVRLHGSDGTLPTLHHHYAPLLLYLHRRINHDELRRRRDAALVQGPRTGQPVLRGPAGDRHTLGEPERPHHVRTVRDVRSKLRQHVVRLSPPLEPHDDATQRHGDRSLP